MRAKPIGTYALIVSGPGDKADPSIDAQYVVFSSDAGGDRDVMLYEIGAVPEYVRTIAGGPGDQDQPNVHRTTLAYRTSAGIVLANWELGMPLRTPDPSAPPDPSRRCRPLDPVAHPVVSDALAAWECGVAGARTVVVARYRGALEEYEVATSGDVFGPSAFGALVAFVDASDASVWLHDSTPASRQTVRIADGRASGVSVGSVGVPVLAIARYTGKPDADIEIWDPTGGLGTAGRIGALVVPGEQRNPHLSGEWVAFEDLSTGRSQVVLWQWTTGLVFLPHPSLSNQTLNDLAVIPGTEVRVVYADDGDGTATKRDIALYRLAYVNGTIPDDGTGNQLPWTAPNVPRPPPATCDGVYPDDAAGCDLHRAPVVLGTLSLGRTTGKPLAGEAGFCGAPFPGDAYLPVLVCVDVVHASSGWLTLDDEVLADPSQFRPGVRHLEYRTFVDRRTGRIAGTLAGAPGASLVARVIADPGSFPDRAASTQPSPGIATVTAATTSRPAGASCGTVGGLGPLAGLALLALRRVRRR